MPTPLVEESILPMPTAVVVFPFDHFGSAGTGAGAKLLADMVDEMQHDIHEESHPVRGKCFADELLTYEYSFETLPEVNAWRETGNTAIAERSRKNNILWLAGNHLAVLPVYDALDANTLILQFDAHLDIQNLDDNHESLSHGNFVMHRSKTAAKVINIGSRDLFLRGDYISRFYHDVYSAEDWHLDRQKVLSQLKKEIQQVKKVWIDIDCDVLDPTAFPAVQHPLPFGISTGDLLQLLALVKPKQLLGVSLSEFSPGQDREDRSLNVLGWLLEWLFLRWHE